MQDAKKKIFSIDLCILILIAAACIYMFCAAIPLSAEARLFPQVISAITFVFTIFALGKRVMKARAEQSAPADAAEPAEKAPRLYNHLILIGVAILYVLLLQPIGFILCTVALFIVVPIILGNRKYVSIVIISLVSTAVFYLVFKKCFYVNLPAGILPFL